MQKPTYEELLERVKELESANREYRSIHQDLELARERLHLSLSAGNLAWWEWDVKNNLVTYNENKVKMLGYDRDEFPEPCPYTAFTDLLHPDDHEKAMNAMRRHLSGEAELYEVEYRIRTKSGDYRWFYDRGSVTRKDASGAPLKLKGIVFDATDRKNAELALLESQRELEEANAAKDKLFSIIGHDLRNSIFGFTQLLEVMVDNPEVYSGDEFQDMLKMLKDSSRSTYEMLENLLHWAKTQTKTVQFNPSVAVLNEILDEKIDEIHLNAEMKQIRIIRQTEGEVTCRCDRNMIGITIRNLLSNAVKFTPKGGAITVVVRGGETYHKLSITDTGIGMDEESRANLFGISPKSGRRGTDGERGSGLGLLLCKEFIERNGGAISVESAPEKGSTFTIMIPAAHSEVGSSQ